ncbi:MAG: phosphopantothenoylcysteine decarboxylase domain-containing protein, partial [Candidatus Aminicenantales bacterium]
RKLKEKNLDLIVANDVTEEGVGFEADDNRVIILRRGGDAFPTEKMSKRAISRVILDRIEEVIEKNK